MAAFLYTSAVFKLYHREPYSQQLAEHLATQSAFLISETALPEFVSITWKKVRSPREPLFDTVRAARLQQQFFDDVRAARFRVLEKAEWPACISVLNSCNASGYKLRTLDAIQLSTAPSIAQGLDEFITFDRDLKSAARFCGLLVPDL